MNYVQRKKQSTLRRIRRVRAKIIGTADRPRVTVYRSNQHITVQAIDDRRGVTLASGTDLGKEKISGTKSERAAIAAKKLAEAMKKAKVTKASFDRGQYNYHGRVKVVAETLRSEGIEV
jgi:large subunit ribosomal protein L18